MIRGAIGGAVRLVRSAVIVSALVGLASYVLRVPVDIAMGYGLVGWWTWALLRRPVRMGRRRLAGRAARPLGRGARR